jgi:integrase
VANLIRGRNAPEQKAPLHWTDVERALAELGDEPRDLRAKALIAVAYSTMARRAELVALKLEDISLPRSSMTYVRCWRLSAGLAARHLNLPDVSRTSPSNSNGLMRRSPKLSTICAIRKRNFAATAGRQHRC